MKTAADNYSVYRFMTRDLGLRGAALQVFAVIYSFTTVGSGEFSGSREYLAETVGVCEKTVDRALSLLLRRGLLERRERRLGYSTYEYIAVPERTLSLTREIKKGALPSAGAYSERISHIVG